MNELITGHPGLTHTEPRHGEVTSKTDRDNQEILERTAHGAVLSLSGGKLDAQRKKGEAKSSKAETIIDDVSVTKKSATSQETTTAETLAAKREEKSHKGDSESFSEAEFSETASEKSAKGGLDLTKLIKALQGLSKSDCRRVLESHSLDPSQAFANLWQNESTARLASAAKELETIEGKFKAKIDSLKSYEDFKKFVLGSHRNSSDDQILAAVLYNSAKAYAQQHSQQPYSTAFNREAKEQDLKNFFEFLQSEDHRVKGTKTRLLRRLNFVYVKALLNHDQKSEKLHYRLEAVYRFSTVKRVNPLDKLREKLLSKLGGDKAITDKAKNFKESTTKNWGTLAQKLWHSVADFSNILLTNLLSLLSDVNNKLGKDLSSQPNADFVRTVK